MWLTSRLLVSNDLLKHPSLVWSEESLQQIIFGELVSSEGFVEKSLFPSLLLTAFYSNIIIVGRYKFCP